MNHIYRIIWNETLGAWVAVAENVKRKGKRSTSKLVAGSLLALTLNSQVVFAATAKIDAEGNRGYLDGDFTVVIDMTKPLTTQPIGGSLEAADGKNGKRGILVKPKAGQSGGSIGTGGMQIYIPPTNPEKFETGFDYETNTLTLYYYESDPTDSTKVSKIYKYEFKIDAIGDTPEDALDAFQQSSVKQMLVSRVEVSVDGIPIGSISDQGKTTVEVTTKTINVDGRDIVVQDEISSSSFGWSVSAAPDSEDSTGGSGGVVVDPNTNLPVPFLTKVNGENKTISLDKSASDKSYSNIENYDAVVYSVSKGGNGGKGGSGFIRDGAKGGNGGDATNAEVHVSDLIIKVRVGKELGNSAQNKDGSIGVLALSQGGNGGKGGNSVDFNAGGGNGGVGGKGLDAKASIYNTSIEINDHYSSGIAAISISGNGGDGGGGTGFVSSGGKGESAGQAGKVEAFTDAESIITMHGDFSNGVLAQSVGGAGGKSGGSVGLVTLGGQGGMGGNANFVTVNSSADITMNGQDSNAITAQSLGGGGGNGGFAAGLVSLGAKGGAGGDAQKVTVKASGTLTTKRDSSHAILAQSIGGGGGNAGLTIGLVSIGANGNSGGEGGDVEVTTLASTEIDNITNETIKNEIITNGDNSIGIYAQSIGGGGGNGGLTGSLFASIGGDGGDGNNSGLVTVDNNVDITTNGAKGSTAIVAQSIGGGGGNGSMALTVGSPVSIAIGGTGAGGGVGNNVEVKSAVNKKIETVGEDSSAIVAQSIGGGGGNGGLAVAGSVSASPVTVGVSLGGKGGAGAASGEVSVTNESTLITAGDRSTGITAQSLGGGGGNGGIAVAASVGVGILSVNVSMGGDGAKGGKAEIVTVNNLGEIETAGDSATGILAQSIAGGGGNGGLAVAGSAGASVLSANIALGGKGGKGNQASKSSVENAGNIVTKGNNSSAIISQSIGGAGGNAGGSVAASLGSVNAVNLGIGGAGGNGGNAGIAQVINNAAELVALGDNSTAIIAQSIGGDGGNGGFAGAVDGFGGNSVSLAFGGSGSAGATANQVIVNSTGKIGTAGDNSSAILAQSIGGTGGNGGLAIAAKVGGNSQFGTANIALGGKGGNGGNSNTVNVIAKKSAEITTVTPEHSEITAEDKSQIEPFDPWTLKTFGSNSSAIVAQSIGGTGGNGGFAVSGTLLTGGGMSVGVALGGNAATGANAKTVTVDTDHNILTTGNLSSAIIAQSVGGDGGNGGFAVAGGLDVKAASVNVALGGNGGVGGHAENATVTSEGSIVTLGDSSSGVIAQSLGGGGGNAGFTVGAGASIFASAAVSMGGTGSTGGIAGDATITLNNTNEKDPSFIYTEGNNSTGVLAQSLGGTGGNGGFSVAAGINANVYGGLTANVALGGAGGKGGEAGKATITSNQEIITKGDFSSALQAQSIGGNGGNGGFAVAASLAGSAKLPSGAFSVALGGKGGKGGKADAAEVTSTEAIYTEGAFSNGVIAQSLGGSGGTGGFAGALSGSVSPKGAISASVAVGGSGGLGGKSGVVTVDVTNDIVTDGVLSSGIVAQSIGGSGGSGGFAASGALTASATGPAIALGSSVGGSGGMGAQARKVTVGNAGNIFTQGEFSYGILAQSINGNGGSGGLAANLSGAFSKSTAVGASVTIGGNGGGVQYSNPLSDVDAEAGISGVRQDGNFNYNNTTRDIDGYQVNTAGQRVSADGFGIAAVVEARNFGVGFDVYGYRIDENGRHIQDSNGEKVLAWGYKVNENGHYYINGKNNLFVDQSGRLVNGQGQLVNESTGQIVDANGYLLEANADYKIDENGFKRKDDYFLAQDGKTLINEDGYRISLNADGEILVDTKDKYDRAKGTKVGLTTYDNKNSLVLIKINGMYSETEQKAWNAFMSQIKTEKANLSKNDVIVNNIKKETDENKIKIISTEGYGSDGILAQSIGGNGGVGGMSISAALSGSVDGAALNASVAVGGNGGDGGISGDVNVTNEDYFIATSGDSASAIRAQSIGGGGGKGGMSVAAGVSGSGETAASLTASVGGSGGNGNTAGDVTVISQNISQEITLYTTGNGSHGIAAESIGGGGGEGGFSGSFAVTGSLNKTAPAVALSIGGFGGDGNKSGEVKVNSIDNILTEGMGSSGIVAKSIAGGGGDGGFGLSATLSGTLDAQSKAIGASFAIGGFGGKGNEANLVEVTSTGYIQTLGGFSNGVLAQSIGGGGGNGGMAVAVDAMLAQNSLGFNATVGGFGGSGGKSGTVTVNRTGNIYTQGVSSAGILAQSIGGGGGNGGNSYSGTLHTRGNNDTDKSTSVTATVGGFGGNGNSSAAVVVMHEGNIETQGGLSSAISAQSIGGGGGNGGAASSFTLGLECGATCNDQQKKSTNISLSVGGWGGTGNNSGKVTVTSEGMLSTSGDGSHGISAQSIGGGGGNGGDSLIIAKKVDVKVLQDEAIELVEKGEFDFNQEDIPDALTFGVAIGGYKGSAGEADNVTVTHQGSIFTVGESAHGILAQSIGGGGGDGGNAEGATIGIGGGALQNELALGISELLDLFNYDLDPSSINGSAGNGQKVEVTTTRQTELSASVQNAIYTQGERSNAILAQSIGGGGGLGGNVLGSKLALGGDGGTAGNAGDVLVINHLLLKTKGELSRGILAQSIGGGGGVGGNTNKKTTVSIGGSGGSAGIGGAVEVENNAHIFTDGYGSEGILAQSIGGGGGTGGSTLGVNEDAATIAIGGGALSNILNGFGVPISTNAGAKGGAVTVKNRLGENTDPTDISNEETAATQFQYVETKGNSSTAILAQSIGGGGGKGGNANGTIAIGGFAGEAGNADTVIVENSASLFTFGEDSAGIIAQSIGGGGGMGGNAGGTLSLGGFAGSAAEGGNVTVDNSGQIITKSKDSSAIIVQSIGGGGGIGGNSSGKVAIGGFGDKGAASGEAVLINSGNLVTQAINSSAIVVQSIAGGGGKGGNSDGGTVKQEDTGEIKIESAYVAIGGNGASAGNSDLVRVENSAEWIETLEDHSKGIVAQSIAGGGGLGGQVKGIDIQGMIDKAEDGALGGLDSAASILASVGLGNGAINTVNDLVLDLSNLAGVAADSVINIISKPLQDYFASVAAKDVKGGDSATVKVTNDAKSWIQTSGHASEAIVAQSIAGGGGTSGSAQGLLVAGAYQGKHGNASDVDVNNDGTLFTQGQNSTAIVAQSISGGGGLTSGIENISVLSVLGADTTSGTTNGKVKVNNTGNIVTKDQLSQGIIAQSIAGGGGIAGLSNQLVLGGVNNAGSDAQTVDVTNTGYIETTTDGSSAIVAQSIGGGGGFAAGVVDGNVSAGMGQGNSAGVTIINGQLATRKLATTATGSESDPILTGIQTFGAYAHGIVAQSIANGGGYTNNIDADGHVLGYETIANNTSTTGESGEVTVHQHDIIRTLGQGAVGILAQSTGHTVGNINVTNSVDAFIRGGSDDGAAIRIIDGKDNRVTNAGMMTGTASDDVFGSYLVGQHSLHGAGDLNANAIISGVGADTIDNTGYITGNLNLGAGLNALNNTEDGWLLSGRSLVVNGLTNNTANWAVSGVNLVGQTDLVGDFNQSDLGTYFWDWNFKSAVTPPSVTTLASSDTNYDVLNVSGDVELDGVLSINIIDPGYVKPGDFELTFVTGSQVDLANLKLDSVASAVTAYNRSVIDGDKGVITANINFAQKGLSKNALSLGEAINQIQLNEVSTFRPVAAPLFYRPDLVSLQDTYNLLSGEGVVANQQLYFTQNASVMSDISMQMDFWRSKSVHAQNNGFVTVSCSSEDELGSARRDVKNCLEDNKWSLWLAGHNGSQEQRGKTTLGMADVNSDTYRTLVGLDVAVTPNTLVGLTYSNGKTQYEVQDRLTQGLMSFEGVNLFAMHNFEKSYVKGVIGYDKVTTDVDRFAFIDAALDPIVQVAGVQNTLSGEAKSDAYSLRLEAGRMYELDGVNVTPFVGVQYTQLDTKAFRENALEDKDLLALHYEKSSIYSAPLFIGAQIDKNFVFSEGVIQPYARVSFTHDLSTKREMDASFVSAQGYTFTTQGGEPQHNSFDMNLGFKMTSITNLSLFGQYYGKYSSSSSTDQGGTIGLELNW